MKRTLDAVLCGLILATAACGSSDEGPASSAPTGAPAAAPQQPLAEQIAVDQVAVYQGVKALVVSEGALLDKPNAPVIANRPAVVRVFVKALDRARPTLDAQLVLKRPGKEDLVLRDGGKRVVTELDDEELNSTMNFPVDAAEITPDTKFVVRVAPKLDTATDVVTFPADGTAASLGAKMGSQTLRVKFVPVAMDDGGVERVPDMKDVKSYQDVLYKMYPVANVEVSVREQPFKWPQAVEANGRGWDGLLNGIMQLRRADQSPQNVYYVGVFTPKRSIEEFCSRGGCVLGIAPQAGERDVNMRVALVLGYGGRSAGGTLAQELAHAMGRWHAPCGNPDAIDEDFPYGNGSIGVLGYDLLTKTWMSAGGRYKDFMSYCGPVWVSDYTFKGLYERMDLVQQQMDALAKQGGSGGTSTSGSGAGGAGAQTETMQSFFVDRDGNVTPGTELDVLPGTADGETVPVTYEGASGVVSSAKGVVRRISGTGGRIVVAPAAPKAALRARLSGIGVSDLRSVTYRAR